MIKLQSRMLNILRGTINMLATVRLKYLAVNPTLDASLKCCMIDRVDFVYSCSHYKWIYVFCGSSNCFNGSR